MKLLFPVFALSLFCKLCFSEEPLRTWTSSDGRKIQARFVGKVGSSSVKIENATGKEFTLPKSRISAADWKYVEKIVTEQKVKEAKLLAQLKEKEAQEELFRLPKSLSGKGCVIIASLKGNVEVFDNPSEEGLKMLQVKNLLSQSLVSLQRIGSMWRMLLLRKK